MENTENEITSSKQNVMRKVFINNKTKMESYSTSNYNHKKNTNKSKKNDRTQKPANVGENKSKNINIVTDIYQLEENEVAKTQEVMKIKPKRSNSNLKVVFLGGVGEIGKNMMAIEYGNDIIVIDCGATFPSDNMPGIDLVVPDITYLKQNKDKIKAIIITHGHEDHIGAIPYVLNEIHAPIYGSRLALALIENKLKEHPKIKEKFISVKPKTVVNLGCFTVEFIKVNHSIAGSLALAITSPAGLMVHTGDFKIDFESMDGEVMDLNRLSELGKKGVLLLTCESTNVEREGYSMSERRVAKTLDGIFAKYTEQRLFVATFASNIHRLQQILSLAEKYGRKVVFTGRSMLNVAETAYKIGELKFDKTNIIDVDKMSGYKDSEILVLTTGSQGESMSALTRMSNGEFPKVKLGSNDVIIMSASPIPGNEKAVNNIMNSLYKLGCEIIYHSLADVHASGHACKEELKVVHTLVKPKFFIPVHGEYRHQKFHKDLAVDLGMNERNILIVENGDKVEVSKNVCKIAGKVIAGERLVDGNGMGDLESVVLRDRKQLAEEGVCVCYIALDKYTGELLSEPEIISRGLIYTNEAQKLVSEARSVIKDAINSVGIQENDINIVKNNVRKQLANYFFKKMKRRPLILTIISEN